SGASSRLVDRNAVKAGSKPGSAVLRKTGIAGSGAGEGLPPVSGWQGYAQASSAWHQGSVSLCRPGATGPPPGRGFATVAARDCSGARRMKHRFLPFLPLLIAAAACAPLPQEPSRPAGPVVVQPQ